VCLDSKWRALTIYIKTVGIILLVLTILGIGIQFSTRSATLSEKEESGTLGPSTLPAFDRETGHVEVNQVLDHSNLGECSHSIFLSGIDKEVSMSYDNKINNKQFKLIEYITEDSFDKFSKQINSNKVTTGKHKATNDITKNNTV